MSTNKMKLNYKVYLEAEDVSQSRILSSTCFVRNLFTNCTNPYLQAVTIDDENDLDDFTFRLYLEYEVEEENCSSPEHAKSFIPDMADMLDHIAQANSYMDMEGSFSIEYQQEKEAYTFTSESGSDFCDILESPESDC